MIEQPKITKFNKPECLTIKTRDSLFSMGKYIKQLKKIAKLHGAKPVGPPFVIYYEAPDDPKDVEYQVYLPVDTRLEGKTMSFIGGLCGSILIKGSIKQFEEAHNTLNDFIEINGHERVGPLIVVYVKGPIFGIIPFYPSMITEFYLPLKPED